MNFQLQNYLPKYCPPPSLSRLDILRQLIWTNKTSLMSIIKGQNIQIQKEPQISIQPSEGLKSILNDNVNPIISRIIIEEEEGYNQCKSESKSTKSETGSLASVKTRGSSVSNKVIPKQITSDGLIFMDTNNEDLIQKYYTELRNSLNSCLCTKQPTVFFKDIAGNSYAKQIIKEALFLPNLIPEYFTGRPKTWNKILLYGPPGVGKTMMARAVAKEMQGKVLWVSLADITSKFIGESEKLLRMLFELAREKSPSIIIIDEMDSIGRKRNGSESETERRIKTEFLRQMDGFVLE